MIQKRHDMLWLSNDGTMRAGAPPGAIFFNYFSFFFSFFLHLHHIHQINIRNQEGNRATDKQAKKTDDEGICICFSLCF